MLSILGSQLAFSAATTLAKKTFEFSITSSLKGLSDIIRERFAHSRQLQEAQAELELKVHMLCLPLDILAHHATQGNTALQEPLGVALGVLEEVEAFRQSLVQADVARAQDAASPDANLANAAALCRRLKELVVRLDSVLPYLNLAISTVALLNQSAAAPLSASRLMSASWHLRSNPQPGAAVFSLPEASWHVERQLTAAGPSMGEVCRLCSLTVGRAAAPPADSAAGTGANGPGGGSSGDGSGGGTPFCYELLVQQDLADGVHHEADENPQTIRLQVADIVALEWETTQSLQQGENEYRPALVLHVVTGSGSWTAAAAEAAAPASESPDRDSPAKQPQSTTSGAAGSNARPASRARSSQRAADSGAAAGSREPSPAKQGGSPTKAAAGSGGMQTPFAGLARPSPSGRGCASAVGGCIRRYAIMLNLQPSADEEEAEEDDEGSQASDDTDGGSLASHADSASGGRGRGGAASPGLPLPLGAASGALQREWRLLGGLEYVLRLCILECREQAAHQDVTDERIQMAFQATSVPPAAGGGTLATAPSHYAAAACADNAHMQRRSSTAACWRTAAAGATHVLREGVEAATLSLRQLSFSPAGSGAAGAADDAAAGSSSVAGRTRSSSRAGGKGFGSPVQ